MAVAAAVVGRVCPANSSLIDTRSSSSLEMMTGEVSDLWSWLTTNRRITATNYHETDMIGKWKGKWELASCVAAGKLCTVGNVSGSWQVVAVGNLYIISELCGSWQAVYRWQAVAASKLWQLTICTPLASCVAVGKPWRLAICTLLASCVTVNELHTVGKPCGSGQSVWELASSVPLTSYIPWANCVAVGKLRGSGQAWHPTRCRRRCHSGPPHSCAGPGMKLSRNRSHAKDGFSKFGTPLIITAGITGTREVES
jgi:hypothetical protein